MAGRNEEQGLQNLTLLGNQNTKYLFEYSPEILEAVDNLHTKNDFCEI